jgi:chaperonin GroES
VCGTIARRAHAVPTSSAAGSVGSVPEMTTAVDGVKLPVRMLNDRVLVSLDTDAGERRSTGGIVIPATAQMGKRLAWAVVVAVGSTVRTVVPGDRVLFDPDDKAEVELHARDYLLLRERDLHAVAAERIQDGAPGLYL